MAGKKGGAAAEEKKPYHIPPVLRQQAEERIPDSIKALFTHRFTITDRDRGSIEEESLVMRRMRDKPGKWEVARIGQAHYLEGASSMTSLDDVLLSEVDCIDALQRLSQYERGHKKADEPGEKKLLNHYLQVANEAGIAFDLDGNPHPLVDGVIVTEGAFLTDSLGEEGLFTSTECTADPLQNVMGEAKDAMYYEYLMMRKHLLGHLQVLMPLLIAMRDRFDDGFKSNFNDATKDSFARAAATCREEVNKRLPGYVSDKETLLNFIASVEVVADAMETKNMFRGLDALRGQQLLTATEAVRRRVEHQQKKVEELGYTSAQRQKLLAFIVNKDDVSYPGSINALLQQFGEACRSLEESAAIKGPRPDISALKLK